MNYSSKTKAIGYDSMIGIILILTTEGPESTFAGLLRSYAYLSTKSTSLAVQSTG